MAYRMVQVGTGGCWGTTWCRDFLPPSMADGLIEVVAAVDVNPGALAWARTRLGLDEAHCYTDLERALDENPADFCTIVVPPAFHESVVDAALAHDLHILSEKPIADSLEASCRIAAKVRRAGKKMGVTMTQRFRPDTTTLRSLLRSGEYGALDYMVCRYTSDNRQFGSWGARFRHEIPDPLMIEGAVHHLDLLADMAGARCDTVYAQTWNPPWGEFAGDSQGLVLMHLENGTRATFEGAKANAFGFNGPTKDYLRAQCERATLIMDRGRLERFVRDEQPGGHVGVEGQGEPVPLLERRKWDNAWLIEQFVEWLDGGVPMATNVEDNLQAVALIFAAIQSSRTGEPVRVQEFLEQARREAEG